MWTHTITATRTNGLRMKSTSTEDMLIPSVSAEKRLSGREVREELMEFALPSAAFEVEYDDGEFIFTTYGYGHGWA